MIGGDEEAAIVERLNLVVFHMMTPSFLPIFNRQAVTPGIVLARPHQERTARILVDQQQLACLFARHIFEEPTVKSTILGTLNDILSRDAMKEDRGKNRR